MPINLNPWTFAYIRKLVDEATFLARQNDLSPTLADVAAMNWRNTKRFNIPFLGDYIPTEWERTDDEPLFVDSTGRGKFDGLVIGQPDLYQRIINQAGNPIAFGVIEMAQLVVLVATYRRKESNVKSKT